MEFQKAQYATGKKQANSNGSSDHHELMELEQNVKKIEEKLAPIYMSAFGSILQELGFGHLNGSDSVAVINAVNLCKRFKNLFAVTGLIPKTSIDDLEVQLNNLMENERQLKEQARMEEMKKFDAETLSTLQHLLKNGKGIVATLNDFLTNTYGQLNIIINEAFVQCKLLAIQYYAEKVKFVTLNKF